MGKLAFLHGEATPYTYTGVGAYSQIIPGSSLVPRPQASQPERKGLVSTARACRHRSLSRHLHVYMYLAKNVTTGAAFTSYIHNTKPITDSYPNMTSLAHGHNNLILGKLRACAHSEYQALSFGGGRGLDTRLPIPRLKHKETARLSFG